MVAYFQRLFAYDEWANRETLASLKTVAAPPPRAVKFMAHIIAAKRLWLGRLKRDTAPVAVWPELALDDCEAQLADLREQWQIYMDGLTAARLWQAVGYTNSKGEPWSNTVRDVLVHVVMHSAYHRGQVASLLRASGHAPATTDFIHSIRQGLVQ